ncbi:sulfite exporter TauE/SafE family protein [Rhizobiaceae bacterium n13]|uniref:Probable membrane transporter protein n=1 Tax=Ferirhizobium litorale TaxID=2927786 RepID=A0AAE3QB11_9HYPH|nr:sulfite exporter TauE/SafE family protein [Fererhizobium litorale]MDI7860543.1 sulfite exporter TauE/SafE family protein [Fererhizobium litorale]MDI7920678.1 sulfite exporter TauE/SafE family protein [Fererhizobium litorale]
MMPDVQFYAAAIPAVLLVGLSKGGLGGALALMGVPILALVVPPMQAAAIFLPILIVMDLAALFVWRHHSERRTLVLMLPGAIIGITLGWATSAAVPANVMRLVLGFVTILFALRFFYDTYGPRAGEAPARKQRPVAATLWATLSGYGSFVAHAGGPPFQIYTLPLKLDPKTYTGMSVRFFAIMNAIKVAPYFALGELDTNNLAASAKLLPVAIVATFGGAWVVRHMRPQAFYPLMYFMALLAGTKLFWDGIQF